MSEARKSLASVEDVAAFLVQTEEGTRQHASGSSRLYANMPFAELGGYAADRYAFSNAQVEIPLMHEALMRQYAEITTAYKREEYVPLEEMIRMVELGGPVLFHQIGWTIGLLDGAPLNLDCIRFRGDKGQGRVLWSMKIDSNFPRLSWNLKLEEREGL